MDTNHQNRRSGFTSTELVVACSLLVAATSAIATLAVKTTRLWQDSRHQQIAIEELSSELDRLIALDPTTRIVAMQNVTPSEILQEICPSVTLSASWEDEARSAIQLKLNWNTVQPKASVELTGWINPIADGALQ